MKLGIFLCLSLLATDNANWIEPFTGMHFVRIAAGEFQMGTPQTEAQRHSDETSHKVRITHDFYIGETEVTQKQWEMVMGYNPAHFQKCGENCPLENVSYYNISSFIARLSGKNSGVRFRLPTEAEWEYACRAGHESPFATGQNLTTDQANYDGNYPYPHFPRGSFRNSPTKVASFPPNDWGLYDMEGNVWEWCEDWYGEYSSGESIDPHGPDHGEKRVIRGGSWYFGADSARCGSRYTHRPQDSGFSLGFRLIVEPIRQQ